LLSDMDAHPDRVRDNITTMIASDRRVRRGQGRPDEFRPSYLPKTYHEPNTIHILYSKMLIFSFF